MKVWWVLFCNFFYEFYLYRPSFFFPDPFCQYSTLTPCSIYSKSVPLSLLHLLNCQADVYTASAFQISLTILSLACGKVREDLVVVLGDSLWAALLRMRETGKD